MLEQLSASKKVNFFRTLKRETFYKPYEAYFHPKDREAKLGITCYDEEKKAKNKNTMSEPSWYVRMVYVISKPIIFKKFKSMFHWILILWVALPFPNYNTHTHTLFVQKLPKNLH